MSDLARKRGLAVDADRLAAELGVPVVESVAVRGNGARALARRHRRALRAAASRPAGDTRPTRPTSSAEADRILRALGIDRIEADRRERGDRPRRAASAGRAARAGGRDVPRVPGGVRVVAAADGVDPGRQSRRCGAALGGAIPDSALQSLLVDGVIAGVGSVLVFLPQILILFFFILAARGLGLPAARGLPARPADGQRRPVGPLVHSAAVELRVRRARHHGHAHDPESARPLDHDHDRAADDVLGAPAGVRAADRRVHSGAARRPGRPAAGPRAVRAVRRRHRRGVPRVLRADAHDARARPRRC